VEFTVNAVKVTSLNSDDAKGPLMDAAIQLWSVRLATEAVGWTATLERLAGLGFRRVEPYGVHLTAPTLAPELARLRLVSPTSHGFLEADCLPATLEAAAALSVAHIVHPHLDVEFWADEAALDRTAAMLIAAADAARIRGMSVGFHNHEYELQHTVDGQPALFALMDRLPPDITVEFDVYWSAIAGMQPTDALARLSGRVRAIHVKDGPFGATAADQVALGDGDLLLDGILAAVPDDTLVVLSLDRMPGSEADIWTAIERSRAWLDERGIG